MRISIIIVALASLLASAPVFASDSMVKECRQLYRVYQTKSPFKAFAATPNVHGRQACGYVYMRPHQMEANDYALWHCKREKKKKAVFGMEKNVPCRLVK